MKLLMISLSLLISSLSLAVTAVSWPGEFTRMIGFCWWMSGMSFGFALCYFFASVFGIPQK